MTNALASSRAELEQRQLDRLRTLIGQLTGRNSFYTDRLADAGIDQMVPSLDAFAARMPFTTKVQLAEDQLRHPPYGSNLTFSVDQYVRLHQTSSTTGAPLRWLDTAESWNHLLDGWEVVLREAGVTARDHLLAAFSFGPFIGFWIGFEAAARMGCLVIPGGAMTSTIRLRAVIANEVMVLCCTPTYAIRLGEIARHEQIDLADSSVRAIIVAGEPGGSLPAVRERIEALWPGATVFDHHGMTEIGPATYQCRCAPGVLHLLEDHLYCEFIDPDTGDPVSNESDDLAELVVTTLTREGSPVLRYRTGDLVRPAPIGQCACGRWERRLDGGIIGRADDLVFVRGVNLYPSAVDQLVRTFDDIAEYRVEVEEQRGMSELRVIIEPHAHISDTGRLCERVSRAFRDRFNLRVPIETVTPQTLPRFEFKAQRWVRGEAGAVT